MKELNNTVGHGIRRKLGICVCVCGGGEGGSHSLNIPLKNPISASFLTNQEDEISLGKRFVSWNDTVTGRQV